MTDHDTDLIRCFSLPTHRVKIDRFQNRGSQRATYSSQRTEYKVSVAVLTCTAKQDYELRDRTNPVFDLRKREQLGSERENHVAFSPADAVHVATGAV